MDARYDALAAGGTLPTACRERTISFDSSDTETDTLLMSEDSAEPIQHAAETEWSLARLINTAQAIQRATELAHPPEELIKLAEAGFRRGLETAIWSAPRKTQPAIIAEILSQAPWLDDLIADIRRRQRMKWPAIIGGVILILWLHVDVDSIRREPLDRKSRSFRNRVVLWSGLVLLLTIMSVWNIHRGNVAVGIIAMLFAIGVAVIGWLVVIKGYTADLFKENAVDTPLSPQAGKSRDKGNTTETLSETKTRTQVSPQFRKSRRWRAHFWLLFVSGATLTSLAVLSGIRQDWTTLLDDATGAVFCWIMLGFMARGRVPPNLVS